MKRDRAPKALRSRDAIVLGLTGALVGACAMGGGRAPDAKSSAPREPSAGASQAQGAVPASAAPAQPTTTAPPEPQGPFAPPPPPVAKEEKRAEKPDAPGAGGSAQPSRQMALARAGDDFDRSQRELDVAAGDCRNACRALGSMDRAAGHICELSRGSPETNRCDEAKKKLYSARDRVKSTCGACDGVSVDRNAPVPSTR